MSDAELKPCPFCGLHPGAVNDATRILGTWNIIHRCKVIGPIKLESIDRERLIADWNTRTPPTLAEAEKP